jgi:exoribonuclease-2
MRLDTSMSRDSMVESLKAIAQRRKSLMDHIDIKELWEILNTEQEWIDLSTMAEFCFPGKPTGDHESAVVRAFFENRIYFKFNQDRFFPNSQEKVDQLMYQIKEESRKHRLIEDGGQWLKNVLNSKASVVTENCRPFMEILKSFYLFGKESSEYDIAKLMLAKAGVDPEESLFGLFVKLGIWDENENVDLYRFEIPLDFPIEVIQEAEQLVNASMEILADPRRKDLTMLPTFTIDGQATLDYDDALSIEEKDDHFLLSIHIADVAHFIKRESAIDQEAILRGSSIYTPDRKIPMLPPSLAENLCSLKAGEIRPTITTNVKLSKSADILDYEIIPSLICVQRQLTYYDVNTVANEDDQIIILHEIAQKFRQKRFLNGAVQISLPEINVWLDESTNVNVSKVNRESPARVLVAELMIMANWLMAKYLSQNNVPAIYRSQLEPKTRLYKEDKGTLFQNWMQRKLLSRFILGSEAEPHAGLGLDAYTTATSPIRKYFDLVTQRQVRATLGLESPYTAEEIEKTMQTLEHPMGNVSKIQYRRHRYWILKYLEKRIGEKEEAIVLNKRRNAYNVLIPEYMIECNLPVPNTISLKPEDLVQIKIQHVNARNDVLSVYIG